MSVSAITLAHASPLFGFRRGDVLEVVVHGCSVLKTQDQQPDSNFLAMPLAARSLLKPWQLLATEVIRADRNVAICMASHSGQAQHLTAVQTLMQEVGVKESEFQCPSSFPMDRQVTAEMKQRGLGKNSLCHPCSGKHLALLWACHRNGWDVATYMRRTHPYHQQLEDVLRRYGVKELSWETDSCGLPTAVMPVHEHLRLWEMLASSPAADAKQLRDLWTDNPEMVAGEGRLDCDLVRAGEKAVIAKEGADGLLMMQSLPGDGSALQGVLIKIASGYNPAFAALAAYALLKTKRAMLNPAMLRLLQHLEARLNEWVPRDQIFVNGADIQA